MFSFVGSKLIKIFSSICLQNLCRSCVRLLSCLLLGEINIKVKIRYVFHFRNLYLYLFFPVFRGNSVYILAADFLDSIESCQLCVEKDINWAS